MTQEATTDKAPPTIQELELKVQRLETQASKDGLDAGSASEAFAKIVKSGDVDRALKAADERNEAIKRLEKSRSQLKTATNAVNSQKLTANAGKRADIHGAMRGDKSVVGHCKALFSLGADWIKLEKGEDGTLVINSGGADIKKARAPGSSGSRGTANWDVDGQSFTSKELVDAHPDLLTDKVREHYDSGNYRAFSMTREAERIYEKLTSGN